MTPKEALQRIEVCKDTLHTAYRKLSGQKETLRAHKANLAAGLVMVDDTVYFEHDIDRTKEVIIRLQNRIERLELIAYPDAPYTPTGGDMEDFRVRVN